MNASEVIATHGAALARIAAVYERDPAVREDLVQDMIVAVISALPRLREPGKLKAFVLRIGHNRAVSHVVQRVRHKPADVEPDLMPADAPTQEQAMMAGQRSARLMRAIGSLGLPYRQVIMLVLEGLSHAEIAEMLGISVTNVGVRVNRAKQQLKVLLGHEG
jgi:RNA polymerase sigma-70 factor (ECF subfamily)